MCKLIAETAMNHEGSFLFMERLVNEICNETSADYVKMHMLFNIDQYMKKDHKLYGTVKQWLFSYSEWEKLVTIVHNSDKKLMLLLNDEDSVDFASKLDASIVELHSVCLNVPRLQESVINKIDNNTKIAIGVGGSSLREIDNAVSIFDSYKKILMFGFQNYPTKYEDVNLKKIRRIQSNFLGNDFGYADHTAWNEDNNETITLMVAANRMKYIEKHVTTDFGINRCDYSSAISIPMLNSLSNKIDILRSINGNGELELNHAEKEYSIFGPMKMAAIANNNIKKGTLVDLDNFDFLRTDQLTSMSQIDVLDSVGRVIKLEMMKGNVLDWKYIKGV